MVISCGKNPVPKNSNHIDRNGVAPIKLDLGTGYSLLEPHTTSQFVPKGQGGVINLQFVENNVYFSYTVTIPPGALPYSMEVTVTVPDPTEVLIEIAPDGVQLSQDLSIDVYIYNKTVEGDAETAYWDEVMGAWRAVDGDVTITENSIEAHGQHPVFGTYAIVGATQ